MKYLNWGLKPFAMLLVFTVFAMVATHDVIYGASEETKPVASSEVLPEVVVRGNQDDKNKTYNPKTVSSSKYSGPLRDIPQTIQVVPQAVMVDQNATTLRETLRNVPGISIQAGEGGVPAGDNLSIRGFNSRNDIFLDGVRDFGGYTRDPFNMDRLEVSKGPASSYAGRGSTGGSVNQVSKEPGLQRFFRGATGFGSAFYKRTTLDINQPIPWDGIPGMAMRLNAMIHDNDNAGRDKGENKRLGIAPSVAFGLGTALRATVSYSHMDQQNLPDYGIPWVPLANATGPLAGYGEQAAPVDWSNYYGIKSRDYEDIHVNMVTGKIEYDVNDSIGFRNQLRYGHVMRDSIITAPRFSGTSHLINRQMQSRDQIDTVLNNQTDFTFKFDTGPVGHALVTGIEYARENSDNTFRSGPPAPLASLFNPQFDDSYGGPISTDAKANEATTDSMGLYAFDTIALHKKLDLVGGVRWDYFDLDFSPNIGPDLQRIDRMFSWRGGIVFKPIETGSIYFGYGTSFNPTGEGLTASSAASATNNINSAPEKTRTFEIGTKWDVLKERLSLTSAVFLTDKTNARTTDPGGLAATTDDVVVLSGQQRIYGIEFGASGNVTQDWKLYGGYAALNGEVKRSLVAGETGKDLINTPQQSMSLWTTYNLPLNFEVGGGMQFSGIRFANTTNTRKAPEYWLFDLMAAYHLNEQITLRVNAANITDQEYIGSIGGGHFIPGAGRSIVASTEFEF